MVEAQNSGWSTAQTIPGYYAGTWPPILVADQDRTVHAFSSQPVYAEGGTPGLAIFYNRWTLEQGWTLPTDIILSPYKAARVTDAHLDRKGNFHVVFFGGDNTYANIYYSKAPAAMADDPHAWSAPIIIGENAGDPEDAVLVEDNDGALHVVYNGRQDGSGIYVVTSEDGGVTWSSPVLIFLADDQAPVITGIHVIKSEAGWLHAVWNTLNVGGQGRGLYYAASKDSKSWSDPILLGSAQIGYGTLLPAIIEYNNSLFVIYIETPKILMRLSRDNGQSWEDPAILFSRYVGVNGSLSLAIDGNQGLHLFFGQRIDGTATTPAISGLWHSAWENNRWTEPEAVIEGPPVTDEVGDKSFNPYEARAVVSQGNVILVTWRTDPGLRGNGVWFSYEVLNPHEFPVVPLPTALQSFPTNEGPATETIPANSTLFQTSVPESTAVDAGDSAGRNTFDSPAWPLATGIISSILVLLIVIRSFVSGNRQ